MIESWTDEQRQQFDRDGFVVVDQLIEADTIERLRERFEPLFRGEWATGIKTRRTGRARSATAGRRTR
jgi:ectoine hydroxylase-related dioxygenase (phytanoyl-CoA dioxygenase family)